MLTRLNVFFTVVDSRFEDLTYKGGWAIVYRDFSAGLIVALTAIPMAMGFAIAMGLRPERDCGPGRKANRGRDICGPSIAPSRRQTSRAVPTRATRKASPTRRIPQLR